MRLQPVPYNAGVGPVVSMRVLARGAVRYSPDQQRRHSLRPHGYDYAQAGAYFVTIYTQDRECLLGEVSANGTLDLNPAGRMVLNAWEVLPEHYPDTDVDAFVVMPNHLHGIVVPCPEDAAQVQWAGTCRLSLVDVVQRLKSLTTARYRHGVVNDGWPPFNGRLWQRSFYERIVRNEQELKAIREYVELNPASWSADRENPALFVRRP